MTEWFDVAVLIEHELTGTAARRMTEMYQMKRIPPRYNLIRPHDSASATEAHELLDKSLERLEALRATGTGVVADRPPLDALTDVVDATDSQEVVIVTNRHRLATLLHRDLASQARAQIDLPLVHIVNR